MAMFTVHMRRAAGAGDAALGAVFVKDGFNPAAFLLGEIWLLGKRLWLAALVYVSLALALVLGTGALGIPLAGTIGAIALLRLLLGLEASSLLAARLRRRGFDLVGVVQGTKRDDAERRFFSAWRGWDTRPAAPASPAMPAIGVAAPQDDIVGLFPQSGGSR